jgi:hypothetical protein
MLRICMRVTTYTEFYSGVFQRHAVCTVHILYLQLPLFVFDAVCVGLRVFYIGVSLRMAICRWNMWENPCVGIIGDFS